MERQTKRSWMWGAALVLGMFSAYAHVHASNASASTVSGVADSAGTLTHSNLPVEGILPPLNGATQWLNSAPLTPQSLRGKVVVLNVWTYSCINSLRALPYVNA